MDGKIGLKHVVVAMLIGFVFIFLGFRQGNREKVLAETNIIIEPPITEPNIVPPITEPNDVPEWETIVMNVSAYCPCEICCESFADSITASGYKIKEGDVFVAAPSKYPFGTEMIVPGYANDKPVEVKDIGGAIKGDRLDVFFFTHQEALEWGREKEHPVKVRIK